MNFFRKHAPPTLHNAGGTLIAAAILAVIGFIKPLRDTVSSALSLQMPLWVVLLLLTVFLVPLLLGLLAYRRKFKAASAELDRIAAEKNQASGRLRQALNQALQPLNSPRPKAGWLQGWLK